MGRGGEGGRENTGPTVSAASHLVPMASIHWNETYIT